MIGNTQRARGPETSDLIAFSGHSKNYKCFKVQPVRLGHQCLTDLSQDLGMRTPETNQTKPYIIKTNMLMHYFEKSNSLQKHPGLTKCQNFK